MKRFICIVALGLTALSIPVYSRAAEEAPQAVEQAQAPSAGERILDKADQVLASLIEAATKTGDFIAEQVPLVVQELILFNTIELSLWTGIGVMTFFGGFSALKRLRRWKLTFPENSHLVDQKDIGPLPQLIAVAMWAVGFIIFSATVGELLKITLAPRVWLLEYAANLVK